MRKLRFVAAAVLICSWACASGDAPEPSDSDGTGPLAGQESPSTTSSATAQLADGPTADVVGGGEDDPTTEGSNTNWMPTDPWLDDAPLPQAHERPDPRKPGSPQGNPASTPAPSTQPAQQGASSASGQSSSSSGSNNSTPSPD